jgi:hypothetical protein
MKTSTRLIIDLLALAVYLVAANPLITGLAVHEWASLGILVVFLVHAAVNYDAVVQVLRRQASRATVANFVLDVALLIAFMVVTVSGIMVSRHILPALGLVAPGYFFWNPVHSIAAKLLLALLIVHLVTHFRWFMSVFKRKKGGQDDQSSESTVDKQGRAL